MPHPLLNTSNIAVEKICSALPLLFLCVSWQAVSGADERTRSKTHMGSWNINNRRSLLMSVGSTLFIDSFI